MALALTRFERHECKVFYPYSYLFFFWSSLPPGLVRLGFVRFGPRSLADMTQCLNPGSSCRCRRDSLQPDQIAECKPTRRGHPSSPGIRLQAIRGVSLASGDFHLCGSVIRECEASGKSSPDIRTSTRHVVEEDLPYIHSNGSSTLLECK